MVAAGTSALHQRPQSSSMGRKLSPKSKDYDNTVDDNCNDDLKFPY